MQTPVTTPITAQLLSSIGFERIPDNSKMHFVMEDVELRIDDDGQLAFWRGHSLVLRTWDDFLSYYRFVKGYDFDTAATPVSDRLEYDWQL